VYFCSWRECNCCGEVHEDLLQVLDTAIPSRDKCGEGESVDRGIGGGELGERKVGKKRETPRVGEQ
jgi:hypothetical protein